MEELRPRRNPARSRKISEIKIGDEQVRLVGLVVDKRETEFVLDDGSGRLTVVFDDLAVVEGVEIGSRIRVFGAPLNVAGAHELRAEIVQNMKGLDLELYDEVRREVKKLEKELEEGG